MNKLEWGGVTANSIDVGAHGTKVFGTPTPVAPELDNLKDHINKVMPLVEDVVKENAELRRQLDLTRQRLEQLEKLAHQYFDVIVGTINKNRVNDADGRD